MAVKISKQLSEQKAGAKCDKTLGVAVNQQRGWYLTTRSDWYLLHPSIISQ